MARGSIESPSKSLTFAGTLAVTVAPVALPALDYAHALTELLVQADADNTDDIEIGNEAAQGFRLHPDDDFSIPLENPGTFWVKAKSGTQTLHYLGRD